jgi:hypothetical protein
VDARSRLFRAFRATGGVNGSDSVLLAILEDREDVFAYAVHVIRRIYRVIGGKGLHSDLPKNLTVHVGPPRG